MYYLDEEVLYRAVVPAALVLVCAASLEAADSEAAFFATRIRPLLALTVLRATRTHAARASLTHVQEIRGEEGGF